MLAASASLTDERKLKAELFDNKILSLGFSAVFAAQTRGLSLLDFIHLDFYADLSHLDRLRSGLRSKPSLGGCPLPLRRLRYGLQVLPIGLIRLFAALVDALMGFGGELTRPRHKIVHEA